MATASSVIVLDSDTDDDGVIIESPSNRRGSKRKASPCPTPTTQQNGTSGGSVTTSSSSSSSNIVGPSVTGGGSGGAHDPQRKRIKPITIATNLSEQRWSSSDGKTPPHNNNNNNHSITGNENFAPITYSEDWEQEMKQYQQKLASGGEKRDRSLPETTTSATAVTSSRSSTSTTTTTTTNDDSDPNGSNRGTPGSVDKSLSETPSTNEQRRSASRQSRKAPKCSTTMEKNPIGKEFQELLDACRKADSSNDMELLIKKRLIRYYEIVHPDYVKSKSFKKAVAAATAGIRAQPHLVFLKLVNIVEELKARRKSRSVAPPAEDSSEAANDNPDTCVPLAPEDFSTGNAKKDRQIRRLNYTLYVLHKRIHQMEEAEVDFNDEANSTYVLAERYKKHAFKVYEKLCDITGESKNAHRLIRKPIYFRDTQYPEFNHTLSQFLNRTNIFPNFRDVLRCLEHCNTRYGYGLRTERMNRVAHDAFIKVGKQLQKRRKTDLYETVMYHTGDEKDPAITDPKLREKLEENGKHYSKVNSIIDRFAEKELSIREGNHEKKDKSATPAGQSTETKPSSSKGDAATTTATSTNTTAPNGGTHDDVLQLSEDDDDDDYDDEDEEDEDEEEDDAESTTKENVRPDSFEDVVISDDEELIILDS